MKYYKIKIISLLVVFSLLITSLLYSVSATENLQKIQYSAVVNNNCTNFANINKTTKILSTDFTKPYYVKKMNCVIDNLSMVNHSTGILTLTIDSKDKIVALTGTVTAIDDGYAGTFDGVLAFDDYTTQIIVDMVYYNNSNNFTAITIGCAGDTSPQILFFGEYSEEISYISSQNVKKSFKSNYNYELEKSESKTPLINNTSVDATTRFQSSTTINANGYETATISLYHANELRNQSSMSVYAKVNSHTTSFKEYLKNIHGFNALGSSLLVYPDSYMIEIVGADKYLHSNGVVNPIPNATSQEIIFPAYLPQIGFFTFGVPITMSSTSVSYRGIYVTPIYNDNIITWNIYKRYGWNPSSLDGYYDTSTGGIARAMYTYESSITNNLQTTMGAYGQIRYEYVYTLGGSSMTLHMWSEKAGCANDLTVIP